MCTTTDTPTEPAYCQVFLGAPRHGRPLPGDVIESWAETVSLPAWDPQLGAACENPECPRWRIVTYRRWETEILGERITFWVCEDKWRERQKLARQVLLFPLERK